MTDLSKKASRTYGSAEALLKNAIDWQAWAYGSGEPHWLGNQQSLGKSTVFTAHFHRVRS